MSRYNSETYRKDLQKTIESANDILKALEGKKVLLTGATGLIGAAIADLLIWYNKDRNVPVELYAAGRNEKQIEEKFEPYEKENRVRILYKQAQLFFIAVSYSTCNKIQTSGSYRRCKNCCL